MPVTTPVALPTDKTAERELHVPPGSPVVPNVTVLATQTLVPPVIVPALGVGFTVAVVVLAPEVPIQPLASVTVKVYMPVAAVVAAGMAGF